MRLSPEDLETAAALDAISDVAGAGIAAIDRGDFTLVQGRDGARALMERLDKKAADRAAAKSASRRANG